MHNYNLSEEITKKGFSVKYIWHPKMVPKNTPIHQVYGFAKTKDNIVALVRDSSETRFTLPGGGSEQGENAEETLKREFLEEVQFTPTNIKLLGSLEVINENETDEIQKHHLQVRFVCDVENLNIFNSSTSEIEERIFVFYKDLPNYLTYMNKYKTGAIQYKMFSDYIEKKIEL